MAKNGKYDAHVQARLEAGEEFQGGALARSSVDTFTLPGRRAESVEYLALATGRLLIVSRWRKRTRSILRGSLVYGEQVDFKRDKLGRGILTIRKERGRAGVRFAFPKKDASFAQTIAVALYEASQK
jgi:hypothetical protein